MTRRNITEDAEARRLAEDSHRKRNWKRWGPYLSERQWGTVREDYSADGSCWEYFTHEHSRSRAYRWGEDGLLGICDRQGRLCLALALWNERDPILKERLFGLTGPEGNHGEDVKELYYYLDATPTHSYAKALYKYPQCEFPYAALVKGNRARGKHDPELELVDTGAFDGGRYFDVQVEHAKASPDDILVRITVHNRGPEAAPLRILPTLWYRNTWAWGRTGEGYWDEPRLTRDAAHATRVVGQHESLGTTVLDYRGPAGAAAPDVLFTNNETNSERLWGAPSRSPFVKDAFHAWVVDGARDAVNPEPFGTKVAYHQRVVIPAGGSVELRLRLRPEEEARAESADPLGEDFDRTFAARLAEADVFYEARIPPELTAEEHRVARQAYAGLAWSKQFFHFVVKHWLEGDPGHPPPPPERRRGRNVEWQHVYNRDVISMPDKWEYPWFAAWDLAFHMLPFARIDLELAKSQLLLFLREWYMHANGQIPAYEFAFGDVNPPVHAWAAWRLYKLSGPRGKRDVLFLKRVFKKLLVNFTWWVNRKDVDGNNLFAGGFLGLDNIGVFDRSKPLPGGGQLEQADGTAWMAFYSSTMLAIALEIAKDDPAYEDLASKFFEHFLAISDAMNTFGGTGLWDEVDGFYYDVLHLGPHVQPLRIRSMVGLLPLIAVEVLEDTDLEKLPGFRKRMKWFLENRRDLARHITYMETQEGGTHRLLAIPSRERLVRVLAYMLDEKELLSPYGLRSLSRAHLERPFTLSVGGNSYGVSYVPGESDSGLFGGNSNWRGPVWFPVNYLIIEALERYGHFYGDTLRVEHPTGSGRMLTLTEVARDLQSRLCALFLPDATGARPCHGGDRRYADDPAFRDLVLFHEYFHGDDGRGLGASHQTGWTALVVRCLEDLARARRESTEPAAP